MEKALLVDVADVSAVGTGKVGDEVAATARERAVTLGLVQARAVQSQVASLITTVKAEY